MLRLLLLVFLLCVSCSEVPSRLDACSFRNFGGTVFSSPRIVSLKEVHLDDGLLIGQNVIITGVIKKVGEHATHLVLEDKNARILVVLTKLNHLDNRLATKLNSTLSVLGEVHRGKKGLPYIEARSLKPTDESTTI